VRFHAIFIAVLLLVHSAWFDDALHRYETPDRLHLHAGLLSDSLFFSPSGPCPTIFTAALVLFPAGISVFRLFLYM
jgi:hypothetical protein